MAAVTAYPNRLLVIPLIRLQRNKKNKDELIQFNSGDNRYFARKKVNTHWAVLDRLSLWGAIPLSQRVVIMTAAGGSAGMDRALLLAAKVAG